MTLRPLPFPRVGVGRASSDYSPLYGLVQGGAIYRSMKVRDDGVVVAAKLPLLNFNHSGPEFDGPPGTVAGRARASR